MEASKRMLCAAAMMVLLLVGSAHASCTVKNSSGKDLLLLPVGAPNVIIKLKVGDIVEIPTVYLNVVIKNLSTGHKSKPTKLVDGTVVVCVDGVVKGTIDVYLGGLINGIISLLAGDIIIAGI